MAWIKNALYNVSTESEGIALKDLIPFKTSNKGDLSPLGHFSRLNYDIRSLIYATSLGLSGDELSENTIHFNYATSTDRSKRRCRTWQPCLSPGPHPQQLDRNRFRDADCDGWTPRHVFCCYHAFYSDNIDDGMHALMMLACTSSAMYVIPHLVLGCYKLICR